jgi:phosphoglycerol geranylgeranyltransferase
MKNILENIKSSIKKEEKLLAILIDPDKITVDKIPSLSQKINQSPATHLFVGGSLVQNNIIDDLIVGLKKNCSLPIILFPGHPSQISSLADGILFLNLISGRNPDYLIEHQVQATTILEKTQLEIISTGYILIESGTKTAVERISKTNPLSSKNIALITQTALAGQFMGNQLIYLEAGSGAQNAISQDVISLVSKKISVPLIVGGGIRTKKQIDLAFANGANLVVIGTAFEKDEKFFDEIQF